MHMCHSEVRKYLYASWIRMHATMHANRQCMHAYNHTCVHRTKRDVFHAYVSMHVYMRCILMCVCFCMSA